jgi:hypothetical protein
MTRNGMFWRESSRANIRPVGPTPMMRTLVSFIADNILTVSLNGKYKPRFEFGKLHGTNIGDRWVDVPHYASQGPVECGNFSAVTQDGFSFSNMSIVKTTDLLVRLLIFVGLHVYKNGETLSNVTPMAAFVQFSTRTYILILLQRIQGLGLKQRLSPRGVKLLPIVEQQGTGSTIDRPPWIILH